MKTMKKLLALTLALALVLSLAITASATTIIIDKGTAGSMYAAYKLLNATDGGKGKFAYTLNEKYAEILKTVTNKNTEAEILAHLEGMTDDSTEIRGFADSVYLAIVAHNEANKDDPDNQITPDATTSSDKFENVPQGYYMIVETDLGSTSDTYSLVMLDTAGLEEVTVETKESIPTLVKKVQEKNDSMPDNTNPLDKIVDNPSDWQDGADYDLDDMVPFQLTGTVSDKYENYKTYYYAFHDKMSAGLTFDETTVTVKVDGVEITSDYKVVYNDPDDDDGGEGDSTSDGCTFEIVFENLKDVSSVKNGSTITVEYKAKLNSDAKMGATGNPNEAKLEYNNNPYFEDDEDVKPENPGETPWDKVIVFTYQLVVDKLDGMDDKKDGEEYDHLEGAGFTLSKFNATTGKYETVGSEIKGVVTFEFNRLDAGLYKLEETTVPAGYNKAADIYFKIEAEYDTNSADPKLTKLVAYATDEKGVKLEEGKVDFIPTFVTGANNAFVQTDVINKSGTELPSTGGIGTTIFYVVGGLLTLAAVVLLVTKKKMSAAE